MTYSLDFRMRVISEIKEGKSRAETCRLYKISSDTLHRWWKQRHDLEPKRKNPRQGYKIDRQKLAHLVETNPDMMLKELAQELGVSINSMWHSLKVMGYSRKKMARYKEKKHYENWRVSYLKKLERFKRKGA